MAEDLTVWSILCSGFEFVEVGGGLFDEVFFGGLFGAFVASAHGRERDRVELQIDYFTHVAQ